jgi:hypothetical protein
MENKFPSVESVTSDLNTLLHKSAVSTLTPKTESMLYSVLFHALYFENEWAIPNE